MYRHQREREKGRWRKGGLVKSYYLNARLNGITLVRARYSRVGNLQGRNHSRFLLFCDYWQMLFFHKYLEAW